MSAAAFPLNPFTRDDTFFGVCQAIGDDFGFNPNWLRICFGVPLIIAPVATIVAYFTLAIVVLGARLLAPARIRAKKGKQAAAAAPAPAPLQRDNDIAEESVAQVLAAAA